MNRKLHSADKRPNGSANSLPHRSQKNVSQNAGSSSKNPARSKAEEEERRIFREQILNNKGTCSICLEEYLDNYLATLTCGHKVCSECLTDMFKSSTTDESRYPPKCCHPVLLTTVRDFINKKVVAEFEQKMVEWETQNRTYCSDKDCGAFVHENHILSTWASCPRCVRITCTECKNVAHGDKPCPEDEATQQALGLMEKEGYKRCSQCQNGVELMQGCNHITCVCGHQFCYICGVRWKACPCPGYGNPRGAHIDMDGTYHPAAERAAPRAPPRQATGHPWGQGGGRAPPLQIGGHQWGQADQPVDYVARREARRQATETRRQGTLDLVGNANLFPERRAALQPQMQYPDRGRLQPRDYDRRLDLLPPPLFWPQPMGGQRNQGMNRQPPRPQNQVPLAFYGGYPPPGQPWVHYGQPGPAHQNPGPNPAENRQRGLCDREFGWCRCGRFHDRHSPPDQGWDRRR